MEEFNMNKLDYRAEVRKFRYEAGCTLEEITNYLGLSVKQVKYYLEEYL